MAGSLKKGALPAGKPPGSTPLDHLSVSARRPPSRPGAALEQPAAAHRAPSTGDPPTGPPLPRPQRPPRERPGPGRPPARGRDAGRPLTTGCPAPVPASISGLLA